MNAPAESRRCYNLKDDYTDDGDLKPGAQAKTRLNKTISDLNKATVIDSPTGFEDGLAGIKTYIRQLREEYANCQSLRASDSK